MGLKRISNEGTSDSRKDLSHDEWCTLLTIVHAVAEAGGAASVYRGRDGSAIALSVKSGKDHATYWTGPKDDFASVALRVHLEWGIDTTGGPIRDAIEAAVWEEMGKA